MKSSCVKKQINTTYFTVVTNKKYKLWKAIHYCTRNAGKAMENYISLVLEMSTL